MRHLLLVLLILALAIPAIAEQENPDVGQMTIKTMRDAADATREAIDNIGHDKKDGEKKSSKKNENSANKTGKNAEKASSNVKDGASKATKKVGTAMKDFWKDVKKALGFD